MPRITRRISRSAVIGKQVKRTCRLASPTATTTVCGRPVTAAGNVLQGGATRRTVNCPDCWDALAFVHGG